MHIQARLRNSEGRHDVCLRTNESECGLDVPPRATGLGSSVNGGELLFLALATCYCNDVYREAAHQGIAIVSVEVEVSGEFNGVGEPARNVSYQVRVAARNADEAAVARLLEHTDAVAEVHNTLRRGIDVHLGSVHVEIVR